MSPGSWTPVPTSRLAALARGAGADDVDVFAMAGVDARDAPARRAAAQALVHAYAGAAARIVKDARGKPFLSSGERTVSIAHCARLLVVAIGRAPVGVDVEIPRPRLPWRAMYAFITAPEERLPDPAPSDFLAAWTAKEAVVKLLGEGLGYDLGRVRVPPEAGSVAIEACAALPAGGRLTLRRLPDFGAATIALATARRGRVRVFLVEDAASSTAREHRLHIERRKRADEGETA